MRVLFLIFPFQSSSRPLTPLNLALVIHHLPHVTHVVAYDVKLLDRILRPRVLHVAPTPTPLEQILRRGGFVNPLARLLSYF